jgi:hypothetical protein
VSEPIETIDRRLIASRRQMTVRIDSDLDTMVTKLLFDVDQRFLLLTEETGVDMAEIMETDRTQPRPSAEVFSRRAQYSTAAKERRHY